MNKELLPEYCSIFGNEEDLKRAKELNKKAIETLKSLTSADINEIKSKFDSFELLPENPDIYTHGLIFAQAYSFFSNYLFADIRDELSVKIAEILRCLNDLEEIPHIVAETHGYTITENNHLIKKLIEPYSESVSYFVKLFMVVNPKGKNINIQNKYDSLFKTVEEVHIDETPKPNDNGIPQNL